MNVNIILRMVDYSQPHKHYSYINHDIKYSKLLVQTYNKINKIEY